MEQLVPIGRFSTMTRLSVKALRHYDRLGLLTPAEVDPSSGYRYYALTQARRAEAIRLLRSVDMPLEEIAELLDSDSDDVADKLLQRHHERLTDSLAAYRRRLQTVRRLINHKEDLMPYDVTTKTVPDQPILGAVREAELATIGDVIAEGFGSLMAAMSGAGVEAAGAPFIVYHDVIDEETAGKVEMAIPLAKPWTGPDDDLVAGRVLPGGTVATTIHRGPYEQVASAHHVLVGWVQSHGHQIAGPPRELYLNDPQEVEVEEQLTEVQYPIS